MPSLARFLRPHPPFRIISLNPAVQDHYVQCRREGTGHRLAEMFALQAAPALETDTRWIDGHDASVNPESYYGSRVLEDARAAGVNTRRAVYKSGLARYAGDPEAWVESRADCVRRAEALGLELEGEINYKPPERDLPEPKKEYRVAPDIVESYYQSAIEDEPALAKKKNLKEEIAESLSGGGEL